MTVIEFRASLPLIEAAQLKENRIIAKNLVRQVRSEMVCPFGAVHDISTAEAFIKQHGSSIVLKGSSAVLEFELQVFRDNAQGAMAEVRRRLRIGASLLIEKYIGGNEFTQYCFTDGFNSIFPKVVRDFPFRSGNLPPENRRNGIH